MKHSPCSLILPKSVDRARQVLRTIADLRSQDFSGVGIVFYERLDDLPHLQLGDGSEKVAFEQFADIDLTAILSNISVPSGPLHDGFHFVCVDNWRLTHVSQFISPLIPEGAAHRFRVGGARLMAAVLTSLLPGIACVGIVSQSGEIHLFRDGRDAVRKG